LICEYPIPCTRTLLGKAWIPALGCYPEAPGQGRAHASVLSYERGTVEVLCPESAHLPRTTKRPLAKAYYRVMGGGRFLTKEIPLYPKAPVRGVRCSRVHVYKHAHANSTGTSCRKSRAPLYVGPYRRLFVPLQGYLARKKRPPPPGPP
jgi:hypothetical protein